MADTAPPACFVYHRSLGPTLGVLLGLAICETSVLHIFAMAIWGWPVAVALTLVDLSLVVALIGLMRSLRREPVTIADGVLTMRFGRLKTIAVPLVQVRGLRADFARADIRAKGVVNLALAAWPNTFVEIDPPIVWRRREIRAVVHKLDDPQGFAAAIDALRGAR